MTWHPSPRTGATAFGAALLTLALMPASASAQSAPDAGQLLRDAQRQQQRQPLPKLPEERSDPTADDSVGPRVLVRAFVIDGATRYDEATLQAVLTPFRDRELGFAGLQQAADALAEYYRRDGWHIAALLPQQELKDGVVRILVVESRHGRIQFTPDTVPSTVPLAMVQRYMNRAASPGEYVNLDGLARATALVNELPGVRAGAVLAGGAQPGETDVQLRLAPRPVLAAMASLDNYDAVATGRVKATANATINSPGGFGEQYALTGSGSEGKHFLRLGATLPVGAQGWRIGAAMSALDYKLIGDASRSATNGAPNGAKGKASTIGVNASYPLWRSATASANVVLAQDRRTSRNETVAGTTSDKHVDASSVTLQGDAADGWMGGGANSATLSLTRGRLDLSRVALDLAADTAGAQTQGGFTRLNLALSRVQRIDEDNTVSVNLSAQASNRNLDAGEKFALGGAQGVRAYPLLEGSGDEGALVTVSWRHQIKTDLQLDTYVDAGHVLRAKKAYAGSGEPRHYTLAGAGAALDWAPTERWHLTAMLAKRIGSNPAALPNGRDSDGSKGSARLWLSVAYAY